MSRVSFVLRAMLCLGALLLLFGGAEAKTPGKTFCFLGVCHRVKTLEETQRLVGHTETLIASHYDDPKKDRYNPSNLTSSGAYFLANRPDNAASPTYPDGTILLVWYAPTSKAVVVRVNNAGPYHKNRKLDLSRAAAEKLGFAGRGVGKVQVQVLRAPTRSEARYKRGRTYPPVAGYIGVFQTMQMASLSSGLGMPLPGGGDAVQVAGLASRGGTDGAVEITPPVRKPFALAVIARAEARMTAGAEPAVRLASLSESAFGPASSRAQRRVNFNGSAMGRIGVVASARDSGLVRVGLGVPVMDTEKREMAHGRIKLVELGRPRVEPVSAIRRGTGGSARYETYRTGGMKAASAFVDVLLPSASSSE